MKRKAKFFFCISLVFRNFASYHEQTVNFDGTSAEKSKKKEISSWSRAWDMYIVKVREFKESNPAFFWVALLFVLSLPLYLFFRKCPNIPDLRFSEQLIAMVYTWAMYDIYEIVLTFFGVYNSPIDEASLLLSIIPLKQLSGFKWWRTSLYVILSYLAALAILFAVALVAIEIQLYLEAM